MVTARSKVRNLLCGDKSQELDITFVTVKIYTTIKQLLRLFM